LSGLGMTMLLKANAPERLGLNAVTGPCAGNGERAYQAGVWK